MFWHSSVYQLLDAFLFGAVFLSGLTYTCPVPSGIFMHQVYSFGALFFQRVSLSSVFVELCFKNHTIHNHLL